MKKTVLLLALAMSYAHAADWSSLFGGGQAQQAPQQQTISFADLFGAKQQAQPATNNAQPGFMESISAAMKVAQDTEVKALMEAKMAEYKDLGFFERMSKVMNDPQLQALIEAKMSGQRAVITQPANQQSVAKPQAGFDWGSLFGGNQQQVQRPAQQQSGFDWSSLFGGSANQQQQQAPQQQNQQGGFGQMLLKLLENAQAQPAR